MSKLTNEQRFKTAEERVHAFIQSRSKPLKEFVELYEFAHWLALEAEEEKPEPCFYCGHEMHVYETDDGGLAMNCDNCGYCPGNTGDFAHDVAEHNRVARAVRASKESEEHNG